MQLLHSLQLRILLIAAVAIAAGCSLTSCSDDNEPEKKITLTEVSISTDAENALRYPVSVTLSDDAEVTISYWETGRPETERTTHEVQSALLKANPVITFVKFDTDYTFAVNINGQRQDGEYTFHTSIAPPELPVYHVTVDNPGAPTDGYILQWVASKPGFVTFCDMDGNIVWYEKFDQAIRMAHYDTGHRKLCVLTGFRDGVNSKNFQRLCDKIYTLDLEGNRDVQWVASDDNVPYPHHDIKFTPDGNLIMVCNTTKKFDLSQFGLAADADVWGDGFTIISPAGEVIRKWNNFDAITPYDTGDMILEGGAVKDFLHANSVNWDSNGDYYMTFNRPNELWKIEASTGKVLYRVGPAGNVELDEADFASGIHAAEPLAPDKVLCYDNGSSRGFSRAIIYEIDPVAMKAKVTLSVPIPSEYSSTDRSNVQLIRDGEMLMFGSTLGRCNVFTDKSGKILKVIKRTGISYRSYYYQDI